MSATISPTSPRAWMMSLGLHGLIAVLIVLITYTANLSSEDQPRVLELVAGPGEDYAAMAAPALGSEISVKLELPKAAPPAPTPIVPVPPAPSPVVPASPSVKKEVPKTPAKKEPDPAKNIARELKSRVQAAERKAKKEAAIERKKEEARLTKEQFDKMQAEKKVASARPPKSTPIKAPKIDAKGIAAGVLGGSHESKTGAGGRALTREQAAVMELYDAELLLKLRRAFEEERPPGLSDSLKVTITVRSNADGSLTAAKIADASGSPEFDRAVLDALRRIRMPPRPDRKSETVSFVFTMREE